MREREKTETYMARARYAEEQASKAIDADIRESWLRVAAEYRQLADDRKGRK
jgi:hypothetical protein